ncbi:DUF4950 domain-containing protein [Enterococcus faecalis]|uniref:DUF4950 domain-containing protein n=1 Tax=Enterococcus faecalis TaxID=1351 RepID=UPI001F5BEC08|nr:DUF4950 domain-containing protein [Enterococcus faecalis]
MKKTYCPLTQQLLQLLTENHPKLKKNNHILRIQLVCLLFVGGWGIPQSGNFFFINPDGKMSGSGQPNGVIQSPNFLSNADGSITMNFIINNTSLSFTKNLDGTLSTENQIYSYLGNITLEQWLELKNKGQMSSEQQTGILEASSQTP